MLLQLLPHHFSICKLRSAAELDYAMDFCFVGRTDQEISLVCRTEEAPADALERSDGWRGFRVEGQLDFGLVGILSGISTVLAANRIGIFAVSTFNTDYILVREGDYTRALEALAAEGYTLREA